ncbi:MAG: tetratricopeptide repeat protein [Tepidisphaeraceae bacterium]
MSRIRWSPTQRMAQPDPQQLLAQAQNLVASGRLAEAEAILRRLIQMAPRHADLLNQTGLLCHRQGKLNEAERLIRAAIAVNASPPSYHANLGAVLLAQGRPADAVDSFRRAIGLNPGDAMAQYNLGVALRQLNRLDEAIDAYQQAVNLKGDDARALNNLASSLRAQGRVAEAVACFKKCLEVSPTAESHSNLLYAMWFDPGSSPADVLAEHERWAQRWAAPLASGIRVPEIDRDPDRRLRIGYVSPDFRQHVIALFMQPILRHRDRTAFEVFCYADVPDPDFMTARLKADADTWVQTTGVSDADLAQRIRADRIDILVDLTAHMARNRILTFARKPAPVQVSYLAYAGTTGLPAMDFRLSDVHLDPTGVQTLGPERVIRLPETYWCYQPQIDLPEVSTRSVASAQIVFACYNACAKINPPVIALWSRILQQLPQSRLRLIVGGGELGNAHLKQSFAEHGIAPERIELHDKTSYESYFLLYHDADIALDPFPYNGGTTTLDALYMGLPVITLAGSSGMSRAGVSILSNAGLADLIAPSPDDYLRLAVDLAKDAPRLAELRRTLRQRLIRSPLMDAPRFVRNLESAYRTMWRQP